MIGFDTCKKYVLLEHFFTEKLMGTLPLIFGDTKEELVKYCEAVGYSLDEKWHTPLVPKEYKIIPTEEYVREMDNIAYRKYIGSTLCEKKDAGFSIKVQHRTSKHIDRADHIYVNNLQVGDEIVVPHDIYGDIPFIVIGKDHDGPGTATILSKEILELLPFDAREPLNSDESRARYGNNRFATSNLLQWLNSDDSCDKWFIPQHPQDQSPNDIDVVSCNPYADKAGFLNGFSGEFKSQLVGVRKKTIVPNVDDHVLDIDGAEYVSSKVFLLSRTEIGLATENSVAEGSIYEYFKQDNIGPRFQRIIAHPSKYCLDYSKFFIYCNVREGKGWIYWLRTPDTEASILVYSVSGDGRIIREEAYSGVIGVRPAMVIKNYE